MSVAISPEGEPPRKPPMSRLMGAAVALSGMGTAALGAASGLAKFGGGVIVATFHLMPDLAACTGGMGLIMLGAATVAGIGAAFAAKEDDSIEREQNAEKRKLKQLKKEEKLKQIQHQPTKTNVPSEKY